MQQPIFKNSHKKRPSTSITSNRKDRIYENSKKRPHTSLNPNKSDFCKTKTNIKANLKSEDYFASEKSARSYSTNFKLSSNNNFRLIRPSSSYKDKEFNKYWVPDKTNTLTVKNSTFPNRPCTANPNVYSNVNSEISRLERVNTNEDLEFDVFNRNLYKFNRIDWESKRDFQFLTYIGGNELPITNHNDNSNVSTQFTNRPYSCITDGNTSIKTNKLKRPNTGLLFKSEGRDRVFSGISHNKNQTEKIKPHTEGLDKNLRPDNKNSKTRPMTAINKNNLRIQSANRNSPSKIENNHQTNVSHNPQHNTGENLIFEELLEVDESHSESKKTKNTIESNETEKIFEENRQRCYQKVASLIRNYNKLDIKNYSIKIQAADSDILDIFDRSQRTTAATLSKVGDFDYYTAHQRIGSFMNFSAQLTIEDIKKIEMFFKHSNNVSYLTSNKNFNNLILKKKNLPLDIQYSLFHGNMKQEYKKNNLLSKNKYMQNTYDPAEFLKIFHDSRLFDDSRWPEEFLRKIKTSLNNYEKYLNSDKIVKADIYPFNKNYLARFLVYIDQIYSKGKKNLIKLHLIEIENDYYTVMKKVLLDYVLRSPYERKRLNIQWYPMKSMTSSGIIAEYGSFNRSHNREWVINFNTAVNNISRNLGLFSIISSAICDWTQTFRHINLFYIDMLKKMILIPFGTIHILEFQNIQTSYMKKCLHFFRDIFYRGVILIIRKNKMLKRKLCLEGKWTFKGFISKKHSEDYMNLKLLNNNSDNESSFDKNINHYHKIDNSLSKTMNSFSNNTSSERINEYLYEDENFGMEFTDELEDFWSHVKIDDLIDIRINPSYFAYSTLIQKKNIDKNTYLYDNMTVDEKINLNNTVTTSITIFLRQLVDKSVKKYSDFILSFPLISKIMENYPEESTVHNVNIIHSRGSMHLNPNMNCINYKQNEKSLVSFSQNSINFYDLNSEIFYREKEIRLPHLRAFLIKNELNPILNLKSKYDETFAQIRLEFTSDEVIEILLKLLENSVTFFNSFYMTHFLEFKKFLPSELEKINKQHWVRLNEVFLETKLNINKAKTFLEDYYANVCPNIIIEETKVNEFKTTIRVSQMNEELYTKTKNLIVTHIKDHYLETLEFQKIFEPLRDLINNTLASNVENFLQDESSSIILDYGKYKINIEKLRTFLRYLNTIPNFIKYSLFAVDVLDTKSQLIKKCENLLNSLFCQLENLIFAHYSKASELFIKIHRQINKRLTTPEELVEMEKLKSNLSIDLGAIDKQLEGATNIYYFLIAEDHIFSENLIQQAEDIFFKNKKFQNEVDEILKIHNEDKEKLENTFKESKKNLIKDLQEFQENTNSLDNEIHLTDYSVVLKKIKSLESLIASLKKRIEISVKDEELLFAFRMGGFEIFDSTVQKLEKISVLWRNSSIFYELRKKIILNFSEDLDILDCIAIITKLQNTLVTNKSKLRKEEEIVLKLTKIIEEDIEIFREFLKTANDVISSDMNLEYDIRQKVTELMESRKLDPTCKDILFFYYAKTN